MLERERLDRVRSISDVKVGQDKDFGLRIFRIVVSAFIAFLSFFFTRNCGQDHCGRHQQGYKLSHTRDNEVKHCKLTNPRVFYKIMLLMIN